MSSSAIRSVTLIHPSSHLSSHLSTLVLRGLGDRRASYFPRSSLLLVGSDRAKWDLSLISRACAVASFCIRGIKEVEIVKATSVQISLRALSFWYYSLYSYSRLLSFMRCNWRSSAVRLPAGRTGRPGFRLIAGGAETEGSQYSYTP
jgi:hypothetical protein